MIQRACARAGFVPRVVARATDFGVLLSLVAAGAGVTLVPALAARLLPSQVRLLWPAEPVTRQIFTVSRRGGDRKPAVRVVLDALAADASRPPTDSARPPDWRRWRHCRCRRSGRHLTEDLAMRDEEPAVLAGRPPPPGLGQPLQVRPGGQAVLDGPVPERGFRQPFGP
jgi:hypothetical protein